MSDLQIIETNSGGSVILKGKDLALVQGWANMIYLALFGGNMQSTPSRRVANEQMFDFWANTLLMGDRSIQFNSTTERTLMEVPLNAAGRLLIEQAVIFDLDFMKDFAKVTVSVEIIGIDRVQITVQVQEPDNQEAKSFKFIWDGTKADLDNQLDIIKISNTGSAPVCAPGTVNVYDLFGNILVAVSVPSGAIESVYVDGAKQMLIEFPFDINDGAFKLFTIKAGQECTITSEANDGNSGVIEWSYNGGAYGPLTLPLTLVVGNTIRPRRSIFTLEGWAQLIGSYV